ncbi:MAG: ATP-binding protein [Verrucomicrobiota bacterium]
MTKKNADSIGKSPQGQRLQSTQPIHGDEVIVPGATVAHVDERFFREFLDQSFGEEEQDLALPILLENMNLSDGDQLNVAGTLLFAKNPQVLAPAFGVKAVAFRGTKIEGQNYRESRDFTGQIDRIFETSMAFLDRHIPQVQNGQPFNSIGVPLVPKIPLEEVLVNALLHRDYFVSAPIRLLAFDDRVEVISPGRLPNHLTIENIRSGNSNIRNPILVSYATRLLPYRGIGSGIRRAVKAFPSLELINDIEGNQFIARLPFAL